MGYIDDSFLLGDDIFECTKNVIDTQNLFEKLGFIVHPKKSVFKPKQEISFLGFIIDSVKMIVKLPLEKVEKIVEACSLLVRKESATIKELASVIGSVVSTFSAVEYGKLYYRNLELQKIKALQVCAGNYNGKTKIFSDICGLKICTINLE